MNHMFVRRSALVLLLWPSFALAQPPDDAYIVTAMHDWKVPGLALAVVKDDHVVAARGYGIREEGKPGAVDENTIFAIGSNTKAFTSAALAILADDKKLQWDDPVISHLASFQLYDPWITRELTIRDMLSHRSGFSSFQGDLLWDGSAYQRDEVVRRMRFIKPNGSFRSTYGYSNIMYIAAGELLAAASGTTWDAFIREHLFGPLGMTRSSTSVSALKDAANVASPHDELAGKVQPVPYRTVDNGGPAASINSTAKDMAEWIRLQLSEGAYEGKRIVSAVALRQTQTSQTIIPGVGPAKLFPSSHFRAYGFGWILQDYRGKKIVWHNGGIGGMKTTVLMAPEEHLGIVVLANRAGANLPEALAWRSVDVVLGLPVRDWSKDWLEIAAANEASAAASAKRTDSQRVTNTKPSLPIEKYVGLYSSEVYGEARVVLDNGHLKIESGLDLNGALDHWQNDTFRYKYNDGYGNLVQFFLASPDSISEMQINRANSFKRVH
jgi:CubicO group peptidase (beta-lactamase class C family)